MKALTTKTQIAQALSELCRERPLRKISVSDVIERTGKNRKTFYYHFEDKDALVAWKFHHDMGEALEQAARDRSGMVLHHPSPDLVGPELASFPFYLTRASDGALMDQSLFFQVFDQVIEADAPFYSQALLETGSGSLRAHLHQLYRPAFEEDIKQLLANRYLPQESITYLADYFASAFIYGYVSRFDRHGLRQPAQDPGPFGNLVHASLKTLLDGAQLRRID